MKKISLIIFAVALMPSYAVAATLTVGGEVASSTTTQEVTVSPSTTDGALKFNGFTMTLSKGVSMKAADNTTDVAVEVATKHTNSKKVYGGTTKGGSVAECTGEGTIGDITTMATFGTTGCAAGAAAAPATDPAPAA